MKNKGLIWICVLVGIIVCSMGIFIGSIWTFMNYALVGWHFYPRDAKMLDLRNMKFTAENYVDLSAELPACRILWNVPVDGVYHSNDSQEITVEHLTDEDLEMIWYLHDLRTVHAEKCTDYPQLDAIRQLRPDCDIRFSLQLGNNRYDQDTETVIVPGLDEQQAQMLSYLPKLKTVNATGCRNYALLAKLQADHPKWDVKFSVDFGEEEYAYDAQSLVVTGATQQQLAQGIAAMPKLEYLLVKDPQASYDELTKIAAENANVDFHWTVDVFGKTYPEDIIELDISNNITTVENAKRIASYFPKLEKLIMSDCGIDNESMAAFREEKRADYKVVWTVHISPKCKARTDETWFMPIKQGEYYFGNRMDVTPLKYCEDMICVDVGDAPALTDCSWASGMPHLQYLILANSNVRDLTAVGTLKELIYLEIDGCEALRDYSPLIGCTALQDINLSRSTASADPLCEMTWLKNLWWEEIPVSKQMKLREALPNTHLQFQPVSTKSGLGWRCLPNYYAQRDILGMYYME